MTFSAVNRFWICKTKAWKNRTVTCLNSTLQPHIPASSLGSLPDEILVLIIDHLNQLNVLELCLVNSRFHALCMNKLFKKALIVPCISDAIIHPKLDTSIYRNFTIVSNNKVWPREKFHVRILEGREVIRQTNEKIRFDGYYITKDDFKEPFVAQEQFNTNSIVWSQSLWHESELQTYINTIKRNRTSFCFNKVELIALPSSDTLNQLQELFVGVSSIYFIDARHNYFSTCLDLFSRENIEEVQINVLFDSSLLLFLLGSLPNLKSLVINNIIRSEPMEFSNCSLEKFCLDSNENSTLEDVIYDCSVIKNLFESCGSSLELVKINSSFQETSCSTIDIFYSCERDCFDAEFEIDRLVHWINCNIGYFPKLKYLMLYNRLLLIDRKSRPYRCITIEHRRSRLMMNPLIAPIGRIFF
ncbi:uncharacterized protein RJT21DRAFT_113717 [Scheffersomyces amazonensis]|uniref:uncharacterized protein n=1 Tax=Scheffersomyces amazonensis TaxID=1078765 RepID=UPI00315CC71E